ncbi:MAG: hypothetical protein PHG96_02855 [Kiritimatiellae bacterium]|nr:hypothetical protein [Kiritimatiellia bacterium]MDD4024918.1 hypothetical protein [Kiritimatiellia bacterium]MDD4623502.1 hypothetical protein [Kiritimatiellia bacterium]
MDAKREKYRTVRLVTGGVTPALLASALLYLTLFQCRHFDPAAQAAGICRELMAGTTEGRQALFGSCWVAPLHVLFYLPFSWLFSEPLAGRAAFWVSWFFVFWSVREALKSAGQNVLKIIMAQAAIAALAVLASNAEFLQAGTALTVGLVLLCASSVSDWAASRRLRDVVSAAAACAFLAMCGFNVLGFACISAMLLPIAAAGHRETRPRFHAWLLLGWLPLVYMLGVWMLLNRLVLGDALFFLRSIRFLVYDTRLFLALLAAPAVIALPALALTWRIDCRAAKPGAGPVAAAATLISMALLMIAYAKVFAWHGIDWTGPALHACALSLMIVTVVRLRQPVYRSCLSLILIVWLGNAWFARDATADDSSERAQVIGEVEAHVKSVTPYGRVFALGYTGLDLLRGYDGKLLMPNLDLHIGSLRRNYKGQDLYVLVPRPHGRSRAESVFWKYPDIYHLGADRLLFAGTFGSWRLFQVVSAPTQEQLDEWRRLRN